MNRLYLALAAPLALSGCATVGNLPEAPVEVADSTVLDEQSMLAIEVAYKAAGLAIEAAVDAGIIRGEAATRVASLDRGAYEAVLAVRAAYRAGNATSYANALTEARSAVSGLLDLAGDQ